MRRRNISNVGHPVHAGFLAVAAFLFGAAQALAQGAPDPYEVLGVPVDVTADSAQAARTQALAQGQKAAFERLLRRLTVSTEHGRLPQIATDQIVNYVRDFSVDEKTSSVRYVGQINVRFRSAEVRQLLRNYSIPFAETVAKPTLVLPVYEAEGEVMLWDEPNPWRAAWQRTDVGQGLMPMTLPLGDLPDLSTISASQAVGGDLERIAALSERYSADSVMVATASMREDPLAGGKVIEVIATQYAAGAVEGVNNRTFSLSDGEAEEAVLDRALAWLRGVVADAWKERNLIRFGQEAVVLVRVPIGSLTDWNDIRRRLDDIAIIYKRELLSLALDRAMVDIYFTGDAEQLRTALAQRDLTLEAVSGQWVLRPL
jgi:hypothetical protein